MTGAGCTVEGLLGFNPKHDLLSALSHLTGMQREGILLAVKANRDKGASKLKNISTKGFNKGDHVCMYDHCMKRYDGEGVIISAHPSMDGHFPTSSVQINGGPVIRMFFGWLRPRRLDKAEQY